MKNKKLVIALSIFSSVMLVAVISLVAVLAAFQAQATGGFNITYTAVNVNAEIHAYKQDVGNLIRIQPEGSGDRVILEPVESDAEGTTTRGKFKETTLSLNKSVNNNKQYTYVIYYIGNTNTGTTGAMNVSLSKSSVATTNMKLEYAVSDMKDYTKGTDVTVDTTYPSAYGKSFTALTTDNFYTAPSAVQPGKGFFVCVRMSIVNETQNVDVAGLSFTINLTLAE